MTLKDLVGDGYKEGMTLEEVAAAIKDRSLVDPSTLPPSVSKETFEKTAQELEKLKKEKKSRMTEDEQAQAKQQEFLDRMAALEKENARMKQERSFLDAGYDAETAGKLAGHLSDGNMAEFVKVQSAWAGKLKTDLYAQAKEELLKGTPGIQGGGGTPEKPADLEIAERLAEKRAASVISQEDILKKFM